jgi:hypothetical protein
VDAGLNPSPWRALAVLVEDLGRGGALTVNLSGVITYDRLDVVDTTFCTFIPSPPTTPTPLSGGALVRVVRSSDGATLAQTTTGRDGRYAVDFTAAATALRLEVLAQRGSSVRVTTHAGSVHLARGAEFAPRPGVLRQNLNVTGAVAGAFNIFRSLAEARDSAEALAFRPITPVLALWTHGEFGSCTGTSSCYRRLFDTIYFNERDDPDQWDDPVHRHELGHFLAYNLSQDDSPGGSHGTTRSDPRLAWSEGLATYLGAALVNNQCYYDYQPTGGFAYNIGRSARLTGTSDMTETGELSEHVVSSVLWHLDDRADRDITLELADPKRRHRRVGERDGRFGIRRPREDVARRVGALEPPA